MTPETEVVDRDYLMVFLNVMALIQYYGILYGSRVFVFLVHCIVTPLYYYPWCSIFLFPVLGILLCILFCKGFSKLFWYLFIKDRITRMFAKELEKFQKEIEKKEQAETPSGSAGRRTPRGKK